MDLSDAPDIVLFTLKSDSAQVLACCPATPHVVGASR